MPNSPTHAPHSPSHSHTVVQVLSPVGSTKISCSQCSGLIESTMSFCKFCGNKMSRPMETQAQPTSPGVAQAKAAFEQPKVTTTLKPSQNPFTSPRQTATMPAFSPRSNPVSGVSPSQAIRSAQQFGSPSTQQKSYPIVDLVVKEGRPYPTGVDPMSREVCLLFVRWRC